MNYYAETKEIIYESINLNVVECNLFALCGRVVKVSRLKNDRKMVQESEKSWAVFTLNRTVKRDVAESVPNRASVHTRDAALKAVSAPAQNCTIPLLKVECSVSDRFLKPSKASLNTFIRAEVATKSPILVNDLSNQNGAFVYCLNRFTLYWSNL